MDPAKKKKYNSTDALMTKSPTKEKIHYIHRNETIGSTNKRSPKNSSVDDGFSSISHSISNPNELNKKVINVNSGASSTNLATSLNLSNQNLTSIEAYTTAQRIKVGKWFSFLFRKTPLEDFVIQKSLLNLCFEILISSISGILDQNVKKD